MYLGTGIWVGGGLVGVEDEGEEEGEEAEDDAEEHGKTIEVALDAGRTCGDAAHAATEHVRQTATASAMQQDEKKRDAANGKVEDAQRDFHPLSLPPTNHLRMDP